VPVSVFSPNEWPAIVSRIEQYRVAIANFSLSAAQLTDACAYIQPLLNHPFPTAIRALIDLVHRQANALANG